MGVLALPFAAQMLLTPAFFLSSNLAGAKNNNDPVSELLLRYMGTKELLIALSSFATAKIGSDDLCRIQILLTLLCLFPAELYTVATSQAIPDEARVSNFCIISFVVLYFGLSGFTSLGKPKTE
jgi:hypothetical protein